MIPFFRKIRKKMADDNRPLKYMRYAIGEILLVMVGILLALQVNNWNNERAHRKQEMKYLRSLKADLQVDLINLTAFIVDKEVKYTSAFKLLEMGDPQNAFELNRMDSIIWRVFGWRTYNPSTNTLDELIGSGNLSIIKNDSIKSMLLNIKQNNRLVAGGTEHMRREYDYYLYDRSAALREMMPFVDFEQFIDADTVSFSQKKNDEQLTALKKQAHAILHDITFRNGLKLAILNNRGMRKRCDGLYTNVEHLIELITQELKED